MPRVAPADNKNVPVPSIVEPASAICKIDPPLTVTLITLEIVPLEVKVCVPVLLKTICPFPLKSLSVIVAPPAISKSPEIFRFPIAPKLLSSCISKVPPNMLTFPATDKVELAGPVLIV